MGAMVTNCKVTQTAMTCLSLSVTLSTPGTVHLHVCDHVWELCALKKALVHDYSVIVSRVLNQEEYKIDLRIPPHEKQPLFFNHILI